MNCPYLQNDFVDEISFFMIFIADGVPDAPCLFTMVEPSSLSLIDIQKLEDAVVWLRYKIKVR